THQKPHPEPAHFCCTRTQQELVSSAGFSRSQWNFTLMRPCSSTWISSPTGPVTTAVWMLGIRGFGVLLCARYGTATGMHWKVLWYGSAAVSLLAASRT